MKVYIVQEYYGQFQGYEIIGVYDTLELAESVEEEDPTYKVFEYEVRTEEQAFNKTMERLKKILKAKIVLAKKGSEG